MMTKEMSDYMPTNMEEVLRIVYPDVDALDENGRKKYDRDVAFLEKYFDKFCNTYQKYSDNIDDFSQHDYTCIMLEMAKDHFDPETIVTKYADGMLEFMRENSIVTEEFDTFVNMLAFERSLEEEYANVPVDRTPISLDSVFSLTEEFLDMVDESGEMLDEFRTLMNNDGIRVYTPNAGKRSIYSDHRVNYVFDGTVNSANTLVHEFMHHWCDVKAATSMDYAKYTTLREFLSIYYENAFVRFMDDKGLLQYGERPLLADRLQKDFAKDPNDSMIKMFMIADKKRLNGELDREDIIDVLSEFSEGKRDRDELWEDETKKLIAFSDEHIFGREVVCGFSAYRFCTALAHYTSLEPQMVKSVFKLAEHIKDGDHDVVFLHEYLKLIGEHEFRFPVENTEEMAGRRNQSDLPKKAQQLSVYDIGKRTLQETNLENKNSIGRIFSRWKDKFIEKFGGDRDDK